MFEGCFGYRRSEFRVEDAPARLIAERFGTPAYIYSESYLAGRIRALTHAFAPLSPRICYSIKANSNLAILKIMKRAGLCADIVSLGEMERALTAGFQPSDLVFAGVGKAPEEIEAGVARGIFCFNVENEAELGVIERYGRKFGRDVACNLRLNLDIDIDTHHYIKTSRHETKFGIDLAAARKILAGRRKYRRAKIRGFDFHLGSQIKEQSAYVKAVEMIAAFSRETGFAPEMFDLGGGFGIRYAPSDKVADIAVFGAKIGAALTKLPSVTTVILEPGRFLVGNAAVLLTRVLYVKERTGKRFVIVDAAMNDLIRPSLYGSSHAILPVRKTAGRAVVADVVGPICESGDYLGKDVRFASMPKPGDLLVVASAGAYGFSMASNYNSRRRPCEVLVNGNRLRLIRKREEFEDLWRGEL